MFLSFVMKLRANHIDSSWKTFMACAELFDSLRFPLVYCILNNVDHYNVFVRACGMYEVTLHV